MRDTIMKRLGGSQESWKRCIRCAVGTKSNVPKTLRKITLKISLALAIATLLVVTVGGASVSAATIIIAASNSSNQWKSQATAVCDGNSDQSEINTYLTDGNTVQLAPGTFNISKNITPGSNTHLYGQGNTTILNLQGAGINVWNVSNIEIDHLKIAGATDWNVINSAIFIGAKSADITGINVHDILCTATGGDHFDVYTASKQISNLTFSNVDSNNPDGFGFIIMGDGLNCTVTNVTFYKCTVENDGVASARTSEWATGFNFAEIASDPSSLTVSNLYAINCSVNGAWESGFHMEGGSLIKQNFVITGCNAQNCGQKPNALYGAGYLVNGDTVFYNNTASNNKVDLLLWAEPITPARNGISPPTSTKTATAINQGNCSGVMINTDATHKELVLYSNDSNPVSQQLELGGSYTSADGNSYSFNGSKIIAQFTNYTIINLVASSEPIVSTNAAWDINKDNMVNTLDMILVGQHWAETGVAGWIPEDINADGVINSLDLILVGQHWTG